MWSPVRIRHGVLAGWGSQVTRQAHNLEIAGSNPAPATVRKSVTQIRVVPVGNGPQTGDLLDNEWIISGVIA